MMFGHTNVAALFAAAGASPAIDADATAWKSAVVAAGGTVSNTRLGLVSDLISSLKSAGVWAKLDRLWLLAAENTQSSLTDLAARASASLISTPTFTTDRGYTGSDIAALDSGFVPSTGTPHYTLNSAHYGFWLRTDVAAQASVSMGDRHSSGVNLGPESGLTVTWSDGKSYFSVNDDNGDAGRPKPTSTVGFWIATRLDATGATLYFNGASVGTQTQAVTRLPDQTFYINGYHNAGNLLTNAIIEQMAAATIGAGLTAQNVADFHTALATYMTAVGA